MSPAAPSPSGAGEAILFAEWPDIHDPLADLGDPAICLPMLGKPLLLRAIEGVVRFGCRRIRVVVGDRADAVRELLQDGERWGCALSYHYLPAQARLGSFMHGLGICPGDDYLVADACQVPAFLSADAVLTATPGSALCWDDGSRRTWSGWGRFSGAWLLSGNGDLSRSAFERIVLEDERLLQRSTAAPLSMLTAGRFLASVFGLLPTAADTCAGVHRTATIHPNARIVPPVYVGPQAQIGDRAVIGPRAVIESGACVDCGSVVQNAVVMAGTYVGEELDVRQSIVSRSRLAHIPLGVMTTIPDRALLGSLDAPANVVPSGQRALAVLLRITLAPLAWYVRRRCADVEQNPGEHGRPHAVPLLAHFGRSFYPGLRDVMSGEVCLVGPCACAPQDVAGLPESWRQLYRNFRRGLLSEAVSRSGSSASLTEDELLASDALACAQQQDATANRLMLWHYLKAVMRAMHPSPRTCQRGGNESASAPAQERFN